MRAKTVEFERNVNPKRSMGIGINPFKAEEIFLAGVKIDDNKWLDDFLRKDLPLFIKAIENPYASGTISFKENSEDETQMMLYSIFRQGYDGIYYNGKYYPFNPRTFESIEFQRNKDPKSYLGIGLNLIEDKPDFKKWRYSDWIFTMQPSKVQGKIYWALYGYRENNKYGVLSRELIMSDISDKNPVQEAEIYIRNFIDFKKKSANESMGFEKGIDPKKSMGIGEEGTYRKIAQMMKADGWTPVDPYESDSAIGWAVEYKHHDLAKFLLDRNYHKKDVQNQMVNYIQWSAQNRDLEMVELLLSYEPDPTHLDFALRMASNYEPAYNTIKNYIGKD